MREIKFYLAGGMGGLSSEEQLSWRREVRDAIQERSKNFSVNTYFFLPPHYYRPEGNGHKSEREARDFDLYRLRNSDVVIVNFNNPASIGTAQELAIAHELHMPVIGLNEKQVELHPWLKECCTRICDTKNELVKHIAEFYLM